jgi:hypothetical protein
MGGVDMKEELKEKLVIATEFFAIGILVGIAATIVATTR